MTSRGALRLLHVGSPVTRADLPDHEQATLRPRLAHEAEAAGAGADLGIEIDVSWDYMVPEAVCRWVDKHGLDLLIVGTQGLSVLPRAILGSTATKLARHAPCSVLMGAHLFERADALGLKGCTAFRVNPVRARILIADGAPAAAPACGSSGSGLFPRFPDSPSAQINGG
jgi:hypothetical protein